MDRNVLPDLTTQKAPPRRECMKMALSNSNTQARTPPIPTMTASPSGDKAARILAKSLFRQLKESGYQNRDILTLSTELVSLITTDLRPEGKKAT